MTAEPTTFEDGAILAATVRSLALDAHRVVSDPSGGDPREVHALLRRLTLVRRQLQGTRAIDLQRWLENLRRQVERARRADPAGPHSRVRA